MAESTRTSHGATSSSCAAPPGKFELELVSRGLTSVQKRKLGSLLDLGDRTELDTAETLAFWTFRLLGGAPLSDPDHRWALFEEILPDLVKFGGYLAKCFEGTERADRQVPVANLGLGDRRYVAITGNSKTFDLQEGIWIDGKHQQHLERILYDLTALFFKNLTSYKATLANRSGTPS